MILPDPVPLLPEIHDEDIIRQVFAHATSLTYSAKDAFQPQSNERLEFLGDSYLNYCITQILFSEFPDLSPGDLSALRAGLVSNQTLNVWARAYDLDKYLVLGVSMAHLQIPEKAEKIIADVFEAYIGGVIISRSQGKELVYDFLRNLVAPTLQQHKQFLDGMSRVDKMAVSRLYEMSVAQKQKLHFDFLDSGVNGAEDRWEAICLWEGQEVGRAKARNQQEAKHRVSTIVVEGLRKDI
jgi:dsRNA-specific ribonuclease